MNQRDQRDYSLENMQQQAGLSYMSDNGQSGSVYIEDQQQDGLSQIVNNNRANIQINNSNIYPGSSLKGSRQIPKIHSQIEQVRQKRISKLTNNFQRPSHSNSFEQLIPSSNLLYFQNTNESVERNKVIDKRPLLPKA